MQLNIAIVYPNKRATSETFIQSHVEHLPFEKRNIYGAWFPKYQHNDELLVHYGTQFFFNRIILRLIYRIFRRSSRPTEELALYRYLIGENISAVLAEYGPTGASIMDVCCRAKVPMIVHFHGFDAYHYETLSQYGKLYKKMFKKAVAIVVVSQDMRQQLLSLGAPSDKIVYNSYGIDTNKFFPSNVIVEEPRFLFVGRFVNKKAPHLLIMAFYKVCQEIKDAKLVMIGDGVAATGGELFIGCKQMVTSLKLHANVEFKGALSAEDVAVEMRNSAIYVQHSVRPENGDSEGTPNSILEACASGLPVVSTRHAGIKDVITDGTNGFLVEEYDIDTMADKMILLARSQSLRQKMGMRGREIATNKFSLQRSISGLSLVIKNAILSAEGPGQIVGTTSREEAP